MRVEENAFCFRVLFGLITFSEKMRSIGSGGRESALSQFGCVVYIVYWNPYAVSEDYDVLSSRAGVVLLS